MYLLKYLFKSWNKLFSNLKLSLGNALLNQLNSENEIIDILKIQNENLINKDFSKIDTGWNSINAPIQTCCGTIQQDNSELIKLLSQLNQTDRRIISKYIETPLQDININVYFKLNGKNEFVNIDKEIKKFSSLIRDLIIIYEKFSLDKSSYQYSILNTILQSLLQTQKSLLKLQ